MRKLLIVFTVIAVVLTATLPATATNGGFVESPSSSGAPTLVEDSSAEGIVIVSYRDRIEELPEEDVAAFEEAYEIIKSAEDLTVAVPQLERIANRVNVNPEHLAVSDLFYVGGEDDYQHSGSAHQVVLLMSALQNFVCVLRYNGESWEPVTDYTINENGELEFMADGFGSYAIVVSTGDIPSPESPLPTILIVAGAVIVAGGIGVIIFFFIKRRREDDKDEK